MGINRRTVLLGFVSTGVSAGVLLGSGAFSSVEAERNVTINTADDSDAVLSFEANSPAGDGILTTENAGGQSVIKIEQINLNQHATTLFQDALTVANDGSQNVGLSVDASQSDDPNNLVGSALDFRESGSSIVDSGSGAAAVDLGSNASVDLTIVIDLRGSNTGKDISTINTVTLAAREEDYGTT